MKKHPVDDLFARKLTDWQPKASDGLWDQIEARQHKVPRGLGWYWYAAASVALLVVVGYMVWQSEVVKISGSQGKVATAEPIKPQTKPQPIPETDISKKVADLSGNDRTQVIQKSRSQNSSTIPNRIVKSEEKKSMTEASKRWVHSERIVVATIQKKEITPESLIAENAEGTSLQLKSIQPQITTAVPPATSAGRVIVAHIELAPQITDEPKSSKFVRILRQLKNAKQGETIEWDEVGFNPKELMARADERLKNEEEKISKKYQELKDKTKL